MNDLTEKQKRQQADRGPWSMYTPEYKVRCITSLEIATRPLPLADHKKLFDYPNPNGGPA